MTRVTTSSMSAAPVSLPRGAMVASPASPASPASYARRVLQQVGTGARSEDHGATSCRYVAATTTCFKIPLDGGHNDHAVQPGVNALGYLSLVTQRHDALPGAAQQLRIATQLRLGPFGWSRFSTSRAPVCTRPAPSRCSM